MSENIIKQKNWSDTLSLIGSIAAIAAIAAIFWLVTNCASCH